MTAHTARGVRALLASLTLVVLLGVAVASSPENARYVCPMHADVRSGAPGKCPICAMALIPRSLKIGNYLLDLSSVPNAPRPGQPTALNILVRDPDSRAPVRAFELLHDRFVHLFVVSQDLEFFAHLHPHLEPSGRLSTALVLPRSGVYGLYADFTPTGGTPQLIHRSIATADSRTSLEHGRAHLTADLRPKDDDGLRMHVHVPDPIAGRQFLMTFTVEESRTGAAVKDLEPFLGAQAHVLVVSEDLEDAFHSHPVAAVSSVSGPDIVFQTAFPRAGLYRVWIQVQRSGRVSTFAYTVPVLPADTN